MYKISELARAAGLSRTTILYYEKINLIRGQRLENRYRVYSDDDLQRLRLIQQLQAGGLTLSECKKCLDAKLDRQLLQQRLNKLDQEIRQKQQSRRLLAGLMGEGTMTDWHGELGKLAPDAHLDWLKRQGFSEKEALRLRWLSKDMNEHDLYMADFMKVFEPLEYWGPGSPSDTQKAFAFVPISTKHILEIGCGQGLATQVLLTISDAAVTALDNEQPALDRLMCKLQQQGLSDRVQPVCASMTSLTFLEKSYDVIWAEGSAYIMGVEQALQKWRLILSDDGVLVFSDMVWRTQTPSPKSQALWLHDYPDIQTVPTRLAQIKQAGYAVVSHFAQSEQAWRNYYEPLQARVHALADDMLTSRAIQDIQNEIDVCTAFNHEFGYHVFIVQKK
ncbi:MerR family transcriptional regulator [Shewanella gelidii]|uniref:Methyltransferase n=1 Tax=Shewanella gelidii TaxID=1642821 RepID=A0A917JTZ5_9GAMM|nr:MerR family transcriptional regulator [Shewanella gelidii]MCL1098289.1 MerR family transcriptional regulator [Shewanella gelidii]GGI84112.1 methyltransferase [Shewanella gelidii]